MVKIGDLTGVGPKSEPGTETPRELVSLSCSRNPDGGFTCSCGESPSELGFVYRTRHNTTGEMCRTKETGR